MVALFSALVALLAPGLALAAQDSQPGLALRPVGQPGSYFDLTMRPGETRILGVEVVNNGDHALSARTYAADVYTIINGGFGGRLRDEPQTGTTRWLDYASRPLELPAGGTTRRSLAVAVPTDVGPGEYITSIVVESDQPIEGGGTVALDQIIRQAVAVVITVPGERSPSVAIGVATHKVVASRSTVAIAVENTGNVRLKPLCEFALFDATGAQVSQAIVPMDTFYAATATLIEVPLAALLLPGRYTVRLTLDDTVQGAGAYEPAIELIVEAPAVVAVGQGVVPGLTEVIQGSGDGPFGVLALAAVLLASFVIGVGLAAAIYQRRRRLT